MDDGSYSVRSRRVVAFVTGLCALLVVSPSLSAAADGGPQAQELRAYLNLASRHVQTGQPVWALLLLENVSDHPITLAVPQVEPALPSPAMGLPLSHVFSGPEASGVTIASEAGQSWNRPIRYRKPTTAPPVTIAPHSTIGTRVNLAEFFPVLRGSGEYRITWEPYGKAISTGPVPVEIAPRKQAEITTDFGKLTIRFFYDDAPLHVMNFIELAESGFYDNLTFHRLEPGYLLQGGCPRGDGTGIRPDGKRVPAELNEHPHQKGSVSMALLDADLDSASSQFFICNTREKDWDQQYTVFGELFGEESFATLDALMATPVDETGRPRRTLFMRSVRVVNVPSPEPVEFP